MTTINTKVNKTHQQQATTINEANLRILMMGK